jgi:hypothetical protein
MRRASVTRARTSALFGGLRQNEVRGRDGGHFDLQVDAIEHRT